MTWARSERRRFDADFDPLIGDRADLGEEGLGVHDDARADHAFPPAHDPGRQEVQGEVAVAELDRVPGVVPAVVAGDDVEAAGQKIHDLPLAFVAPLSAEDCRHFHVAMPFRKNEAG